MALRAAVFPALTRRARFVPRLRRWWMTRVWIVCGGGTATAPDTSHKPGRAAAAARKSAAFCLKGGKVTAPSFAISAPLRSRFDLWSLGRQLCAIRDSRVAGAGMRPAPTVSRAIVQEALRASSSRPARVRSRALLPRRRWEQQTPPCASAHAAPKSRRSPPCHAVAAGLC